MRRFLTPLCFILTAVFLFSWAMSVSAVTRQKAKELREKKDEKTQEQVEKIDYGRQSKNLGIFILIGKVVGEAATEIDRFDGGLKNKLYGGIGGSLEMALNDRFFLSGTLEAEWNWPNDAAGTVRTITPSIRAKYLFSPFSHGSFYAAAGVGQTSGKYLDADFGDADLGSHFAFYFGLGRQIRVGGKSINGFELYYRKVSSKDDEADIPYFSAIPIDASTIGFRGIVGFGF